MSLISENIIPGDYGKSFVTDAKEDKDLERIKKAILRVEGIKDVEINYGVYPKEFTVHTSKIVTLKAIENEINAIGFHAVVKSLF
ncbi:heavy-metal-associated domain-containing protein [Gaetbulibacter saemankumensis]|uniref:heavy-metal-associated domain-containing protein n=1 Tax=Gaetbulibacter saemankumensis TaxID=311208 RepID=UPI00041EFFF2|nr:heavy metal-associated domain-containing protein [Gaetbulibacter saemankumensis]